MTVMLYLTVPNLKDENRKEVPSVWWRFIGDFIESLLFSTSVSTCQNKQEVTDLIL